MRIIDNHTEKIKVLVTGGAGFIGGAVIRKLLKETNWDIFNLDKLGYASDLTSINETILTLGIEKEERYKLLKVDLTNNIETFKALKFADPDLIMHLAAESHVDRSINGPGEFIKSNILGTFNLLEASREHYEKLTYKRKSNFLFHHVSTDEVYGTLGKEGKFRENSQYDPRSPYSATKASSDHLVNSWHHTFGLPIIMTNCSNNYGPWQYPEKLIPKIIVNALNNSKIPIYGRGENIRDWLFVDDHTDALFNVITRGKIGEKYCIGGNQEKTNNQIAELICGYLDKVYPCNKSYKSLITYVKDRKGHDFRYSIDTTKINKELKWEPKYKFEEGLKITIDWYLNNIDFIKIKNPKIS